MFFNDFPYTDFHELNLDWIIRMMKELRQAMTDFEAMNKITFAGAWDITKQYPAWNIVNNGDQGYISIRPVPAGVNITDQNYWRGVVDYTATIADLQNRVVAIETKLANVRIINVRDYGAKGDGLTDDTASIQAAIDAAVSKKSGVVWIPRGNYLISNTLMVATDNNQNVSLIGSGWGSTILTRASSFTSGPMISVGYAGFNLIKNMRLENGGKVFFANTGFGIEITTRCICENVVVMNGYGGFDVNSSMVTLKSCHYYDEYTYSADYDAVAGLRVGVTTHVSAFVADGCFFEGQDPNAAHPLGAGILIQGADGQVYTGCSARGNIGVKLLSGGSIHIDDVYFENCIFDNCITKVLEIYNGGGPVNKNVRFNGCHINGTLSGDMVRVKGFDHVQFVACNFQLAWGNTMLLQNVSDVIIANNIFEANNQSGAANIQEITGSGDAVSVTGNVFGSDNNAYDLVCSSFTNLMAANNIFKHGMYGTPTVDSGNLTRA